MKSKKAQIMGLPFVYILALIVGALILVWGAKTVLELRDTAGTVEAGKFLKSLEAQAKTFYNYEAGSMSNAITINLGTKLTHICFADGTKTGICMLNGKGPCPNTDDFSSLAFTAQTYKDKKNIYFIPMNTELSNYLIPNLKPGSGTGNPACFANGQKIYLYSAGTHVEVVTS